MRFIHSVLLTLGIVLPAFAQKSVSPLKADELPVLNHFDPNLADRTQDPCNDFYKFVCSKWQAANPIPPDQAKWGNWIQPSAMERERTAQCHGARRQS